jgi:hypothetical protein
MRENNKSILHGINNSFHNGWFIWQLLQSKTQRRHVFRWIYSLKKNYLFDTPSPWLVFDAISYIKPHLFRGMKVFEYGSGGSTLFWLYYGADVVSVEHDPQWYNLVKNKLQSSNSVDYRLIVPEIATQNDPDFDPSDPEKYFSADDSYRHYQFHNYVTQIDAFPDEHFDLILIDGRARPSCLKHSVKKVKVGGQIILDNSDRDYYLINNEKYLKNFSKIEFCGAIPENNIFSKTSIYTRLN